MLKRSVGDDGWNIQGERSLGRDCEETRMEGRIGSQSKEPKLAEQAGGRVWLLGGLEAQKQEWPVRSRLSG